MTSRELADPTVGLSISPADPNGRVTVEMGGADTVAGGRPSPLVALTSRSAGAHRSRGRRRAHIVVADQIAAEAKEHLAAAGWSWLDRRSELRLRHGDTTIEIRLPPGGLHPQPRLRMALAAPASDSPIRGRAGISYAAALLLGGDGRPPSIRSVARQIGMAPSTVSEAAAHLRAGGYILPNGEPRSPTCSTRSSPSGARYTSQPVATRPAPRRARDSSSPTSTTSTRSAGRRGATKPRWPGAHRCSCRGPAVDLGARPAHRSASRTPARVGRMGRRRRDHRGATHAARLHGSPPSDLRHDRLADTASALPRTGPRP